MRINHGESRSKRNTTEHASWESMIWRCYNPKKDNYKWYGGKGIRVCDRWRGPFGFKNFLSDMGRKPEPKMQIDRYPERNGNYEPGNCRWATRTEQMRNYSGNKFVTFNGETLPLVEWADRYGIPKKAMWGRMRSGWTIEEALFTPPGIRGWNLINGRAISIRNDSFASSE